MSIFLLLLCIRLSWLSEPTKEYALVLIGLADHFFIDVNKALFTGCVMFKHEISKGSTKPPQHLELHDGIVRCRHCK